MSQPTPPEEQRPAEAPAPEETNEENTKEKKRKPGAFAADVYGWFQALAFALAFLLIFFTFFGRIIGVDGHSMDPTLNDQDMLYLSSFRYEPQQGDIVVLHKNFEGINKPIVKRVIAVGGQTVEIDYDTNTVYVDGEPIHQDFILEPMVQPSNPAMQQTYWEVPEGSVFVMGDNRNNSLDSRDDELGPVDNRYILGKAIYTLLPAEHADAHHVALLGKQAQVPVHRAEAQVGIVRLELLIQLLRGGVGGRRGEGFEDDLPLFAVFADGHRSTSFNISNRNYY